jgi:RimJ/RimL family protein N-acetyltransferase
MMFETERLIVRRLDEDDLDALFAVYGDADTMRWVDDGVPLTRELCVEWVAVTHDNYAARGYGMSALVLKETGAVVGFCGLVHPGGQELPELKYALLRLHLGRGLASEAAAAMVAYGAMAFSMQRILSTVAAANAASIRVLEKAGFRRTDTRRNDDGTETLVFEWRPPQPA